MIIFNMIASLSIYRSWPDVSFVRSKWVNLRQSWILVACENSRHLATPPTVSSRNDVWETSTEIPHWWRVSTQMWVVFLIGRAARKICLNQSEALPRSWYWRHVISMEFLRFFSRRPFAEKPVVASVFSVLDSGFHTVYSGFQILDSRFLQLSATWIPDPNRIGIPQSLSWIPDSKAQDSEFNKQKLPSFRNPYYLRQGVRYCIGVIGESYFPSCLFPENVPWKTQEMAHWFPRP